MYQPFTFLSCESNRLVALDVSSCPQLANLSCSDNRLASLTGLAACKDLQCSNSRARLDISSCTEQLTLSCDVRVLATVSPSVRKTLHTLSLAGLVTSRLAGFQKLRDLSCHLGRGALLDLTGCDGVNLCVGAALTRLNFLAGAQSHG